MVDMTCSICGPVKQQMITRQGDDAIMLCEDILGRWTQHTKQMIDIPFEETSLAQTLDKFAPVLRKLAENDNSSIL